MMKPRLFQVTFAAFWFAAVTVLTLQAADAEDARPNILFAIADDASYPHVGAYGCTWVTTPGFDRVARQGLLFTHAYTPNAKCAPSRASILTGRNAWQLEEAANHWCVFPAKFKVYTEALAEHGELENTLVVVTADNGMPYVLWLVADDHAAYVTGCYGNTKVQTPNLDALAASGMRFDWAYCNAPVCTASTSGWTGPIMPRCFASAAVNRFPPGWKSSRPGSRSATRPASGSTACASLTERRTTTCGTRGSPSKARRFAGRTTCTCSESNRPVHPRG